VVEMTIVIAQQKIGLIQKHKLELGNAEKSF
jgi:hypothetical protein